MSVSNESSAAQTSPANSAAAANSASAEKESANDVADPAKDAAKGNFASDAVEQFGKATEALQDMAPAIGPSMSLPAAKHFDWQLGIDFHSYSGPTPGMLPTPHVGMVFDPFDYIPFMGSTVYVDGAIHAGAGTGGVALHIPVGAWLPTLRLPLGVQLDNEIFLGSKTVLADGAPFSRTTMSVLDCAAAGMVEPPVGKPKKPKLSAVLPSAINLSVPSTTIVGGPSTVNMTALAMKGAFAALGKGLKAVKKLKKGKVEVPKPKPHIKAEVPTSAYKKFFADLPPGFLKCKILKAEPVDIRRGSVDVAQQDFTISGRLPLPWPRHYASSRCDEFGLSGQGWRTPADLRLELEVDGTIGFTGPHITILFPRLPEAPGIEHAVRELRDGARLYRIDTPAGSELRVRDGNLLYVFFFDARMQTSFTGHARILPIERIEDLCGNAWQFERVGGHLQRIVESGIDGLAGRYLHVTAARDGRIESIALHDPATGPVYPQVSYRQDRSGNLIAAADALGAERCFGYTGGHYLKQHTDRLGQSFYYDYDDQWQVIRAWGDGGLHDYRFVYHHELRETEVIDSLGHVSLIRFDENNLPACEIDPLGGVTTYRYDAVGHTVEIVDPAGLRTAFEFDDLGNEVQVVLPDGGKTHVQFDQDSNPVELSDASGRSWKQVWDARGLLLSQTNPLGATTRFSWDEYGQLREHVSVLGAKTQLGFDRHGHLSSVTNALGHVEQFQYDGRGCLLARDDALEQRTTYAYDIKGRLTQVNKADGTSVHVGYDAEDQPIAYADEKGERTRLEYAGTGKLTALHQADGHSTRYLYDTEEQLTGVIDQNGDTWALRRDALGRIVEEVDYWGQSTHYRYDAAGRLQTRVDALGQEIAYQTDRLGRITCKTMPDPDKPGELTHERFRYDASGALVEMLNAHRRVMRSFDDAGRLIEEQQDSFSVQYAYDEADQCIERTTSAGNRIAHGYDALGQLVSITLGDAAPVLIERDALGRTRTEQLGAGLTRQFEYDANGRLTAQAVMRDETSLFTTGYEYDATGNLTHRRDSERGVDAYRYDPIGRLLEHVDPAGKISRFVTDAAGNHLRTRIRASGVDMADDGEALPSRWQREGSLDGTRYVFDAAGNLTLRESAAPGSGSDALHLRWDANHRLIESRRGDQVTRYGYDPAGRRVFKRNPAQTTWFFWDGDALLGEVKLDNAAADAIAARSGVPMLPSVTRKVERCYVEHGREYVYYPESFHPFALIEGRCKGKAVYHYHTDPNGCPTRLTDASGMVVWGASGTAWGGVGREDVREVEQVLRLQGQYYDPETGLHYNRYRCYDPNTGSFISQDPIGLIGGTNPYEFAPNVLRWIDPWGLEKYVPPSPAKISPAHSINTIGPNTRFGNGDKSVLKTVAEGHVDLDADLAEINAGKADLIDNGYIKTSSGRIYGYHTETPGVFPRSGPGLVQVTQAEFGILKQMTQSGGLQGDAKRAFDGMRAAGNGGLSDASEAKLISLFNTKCSK